MFKLDSPFMNFLNKVCDIMILNILILVFSIPVFTVGAAITAAYYMSYKMVRNEESYIVKGFWKAFKENFKQSTVMWLIVLAIVAVLYGDYKIMTESGIEFQSWLSVAIITVTIVLTMGFSFLFPMQARFSNTIKNTMKNSFLMALSHLPSAFLFTISYAVPVVLLYFIPRAAPAIVLLAFGALPYFKSFLFLKIFKKYEDNLIARSEEDAQEDTLDSGIFSESEAMEKESENSKENL